MAHRCSNAAEGSFEVELAWPGSDAVLADFASQKQSAPTASPASWERLTGAFTQGVYASDSVGNNGRFLYSAEILRDLPLAMSAERFQRYLTRRAVMTGSLSSLHLERSDFICFLRPTAGSRGYSAQTPHIDKLRHHFGGQWFRSASVPRR